MLVELRHPEAPPEVLAWASAPPLWLGVRQVQQVDPTLAAELGAGEREAISLALEAGADLLLIDERAGRQEAESRRIAVAGTLAVLLHASLRGDRTGNVDFPTTLKQLKQFGFRVSKSVEAVMLARYEQAKRGNL